MLYPHDLLKPAAYGFQYLTRSVIPIRLEGIGWEKATSPDYRWNGLSRGECHAVIFQYTLSGRGELIYQGQRYELERQSGFFATIPSDHEYYLPKGESHWEYLFMTVHGEDAFRHWSAIIEKMGPVVCFKEFMDPIQMVSGLFADISGSDSFDKYAVSAKLYSFLMEIQRMIDSESKRRPSEISLPLMKAMEHMREHFDRDLSLNELSGVSNLSKHYFCRQFHAQVGMSPIHYLRKIRIERAVWLLRNTTETVAGISRITGFANCNYFIKVFRSMTGTTPNNFRNSDGEYFADHLRFEI